MARHRARDKARGRIGESTGAAAARESRSVSNGPHAVAGEAAAGSAADLWIFGYGSLMWHPGFAYEERVPALLRGYHRAFCVYSHRYRGTQDRPGLVLGLRPGGSCRGVAYRIGPAARDTALAYLTEREMMGKVYFERRLPVMLADGRLVRAQTYVVDLKHQSYTGKLEIERVAELIRQGIGERGACLDYLVNTVRHLDALGIKDGPLHALMRTVEAKRGS